MDTEEVCLAVSRLELRPIEDGTSWYVAELTVVSACEASGRSKMKGAIIYANLLQNRLNFIISITR